jgi:hypothetical protein
MVEGQQLHETNHIYSIMLMKKDSEWCVYQVKVKGEVHRDFFVEITASQNAREGVIKCIESFCESNFAKLPQDGGIISLNSNT